ncbi:SoxR reducing system RseC family protein [Clostridium saccharoperbutylacetonicum]|uniref:SoxR reducing system RseC family protein n=1 Tax=Clostridium saccharoperbutylacetonicum TaxID=36745 RepID=UPI0039ECCF72
MKTEQGLVIEVNENVARIKVGRHSECKNCGACPGNNGIIIEVDNKIGAKIGQRVAFEVKETNFITSVFIVFVLPLIVLFIGVLLGEVIGNLLGLNVYLWQIIGGFIFVAVAIGSVKKFDNYIAKNHKSIPRITKIL